MTRFLLLFLLLVSCQKESPVLEQKIEHLQWPMKGRVTSLYGKRWNGFHSGIDITGPAGLEIKATAPGFIDATGPAEYYGLVILINHGKGLQTFYAHNSKILVRKGQFVKAGENIALIGSTGLATGRHLHFEVWENGQHVNPLNWLPYQDLRNERHNRL
jgi:murein DD-endopeptidase MepM/ murein hydrolase activator NlpD